MLQIIPVVLCINDTNHTFNTIDKNLKPWAFKNKMQVFVEKTLYHFWKSYMADKPNINAILE